MKVVTELTEFKYHLTLQNKYNTEIHHVLQYI